MEISSIRIRVGFTDETAADEAKRAAAAFGIDAEYLYSSALATTYDFTTDEPNKVGPFVSRLEAIGRMTRTGR